VIQPLKIDRNIIYDGHLILWANTEYD